jgi:hypothetical protein
MAEIQSYKVPVLDDGFVIDTRNLHEYKENECDKEEKGCY